MMQHMIMSPASP